MAVNSVFASPLVERLGWALVHFLWQAAAVAGSLAAVMLLLRRRSANARYVLACGALLVMAAMPVITALVVEVQPAPRAQAAPVASEPAAAAPAAVEVAPSGPEITPPPVPLPAAPAPGVAAAPAPELQPAAAPRPAPAPPPAQPWRQRAGDLLRPHMPWIVVGWLLGVGALSLWHLGGLAQVRRLRHSGNPAGGGLLESSRRICRRLRVSRPVRLLESALVRTPTVVGFLRPVVLLPASALTGLTSEQLEAILAHELAHVRRHDYLVNLLQSVLETLLFYHPAVWWVSGRVRAERENCCDDLAVSACGDRATYARALARAEELRGRAPRAGLTARWTTLAAAGGSLLDRVRRILGRPSGQPDLRATLLAGATVLLALTTAAAVFYGAAVAVEPAPAVDAATQPAGEAEIAELVRKLRSDDETIWRRAAKRLIEIGPAVAEPVAELFRAGPGDAHALEVLKALATDPHVQEVVLRGVSSTRPNVPTCAMFVLGRSGNPSHVKAIAQRLRDHPIAAAIALAQLGGDEAHAALVRGLREAPGDSVWFVAGELAKLKRPEAIPPLKEALKRTTAENLTYAARIVEAIRTIDGKARTAFLYGFSLHAIGDRQWRLLEAYDLAGMEVVYVQPFRPEATDPQTRARAYQALLAKGAGHLAVETHAGGRLLVFGGLKLAPLTLTVPGGYDLWGDAHRFFHQRELARQVEQYNRTRSAELAGPVAGTRAHPFMQDDQFIALLPDGRVALLKVKLVLDQTKGAVRRSIVHMAAMPLDPLYALIPPQAYRPPAAGAAALHIRLVGIQPDGSEDVLDVNGKKVGQIVAFRGGGFWGPEEQHRTFVFEVPKTDQQFLPEQFFRVRTSPEKRPLSSSQGSRLIEHQGKRLLVCWLITDRSFKQKRFLFTRTIPIEKVDLTLRYYYGPPRECEFSFTGPFTPGTTARADGGKPCTLALKHDDPSGAGACFHLSTKVARRQDSRMLVYDTAGRRHLGDSRGGRSGPRGEERDYGVHGVPLRRIARIVFGERPHEKTFTNVPLRFPGRPVLDCSESLDKMAKVLGRSAKDINDHSVKTLDEAIKVADIARGNHMLSVYNQFASAKFAELPPEQQKKLREVALAWAQAPHPRIRDLGVRLGMQWGGGSEFVDAALKLLDAEDDYVRRQAAASLGRGGGLLSAQDVRQVKQRVLAKDDPAISHHLVQCLRANRTPASTEALWELARADDDRPWLWWPALEPLRRRREIKDRPSLPKRLRLRLILTQGVPESEQHLAGEAYGLLPGLLTPKLQRMNGSVLGSVYRLLRKHVDRPRATKAMVEFLRGVDVDGSTDWVINSVVKRLNLWYGVNLGKLGWDVRDSWSAARMEDRPAIVAEVLKWYQAGKLEPPGRTVPAEGTFDPTTERVVNTGSARKDCFIDLDTGVLASPPDEMAVVNLPRAQREKLQRWCRQNGIDALCYADSGGGNLRTFDMVISPVPVQFWKTAGAEAIGQALQLAGRHSSYVDTSVVNALPATVAFKTAKGGVGLLQILAITDNPRGLSIRYKMLRRPKPAEPATTAAGSEGASTQPAEVYVMAGDRPGVYSLAHVRTVSQALKAAGLEKLPKNVRLYLLRAGPGRPTTEWLVNAENLLSGKAEDIPLQERDVLATEDMLKTARKILAAQPGGKGSEGPAAKPGADEKKAATSPATQPAPGATSAPAPTGAGSKGASTQPGLIRPEEAIRRAKTFLDHVDSHKLAEASALLGPGNPIAKLEDPAKYLEHFWQGFERTCGAPFIARGDPETRLEGKRLVVLIPHQGQKGECDLTVSFESQADGIVSIGWRKKVPATQPATATAPAGKGQELTLEGAQVTNESLEKLKGLRLESLILYKAAVTDEGLAQLAGVGSLKKLYLRTMPGIKGPGLAHLQAIRGLESLDLLGTSVEEKSLVHLVGAQGLRELSLGYMPLTEAGLAQLGRMTNLRRLGLYGCPVTDAGLAKLEPLRHLEGLDLTHTRVTDAGLERLKAFRNLKALSVGSHEGRRGAISPISNAGVAHLAALVNLEALHFNGPTAVTDEGVKHLAGLKRLKHLSLVGTNASGHALKEVRDLPELESLMLSGSQAATGIEHLAAMKKLSSVLVFGQFNREWDEQWLQRLRGALPPGCHVGWIDP